MAGIDGAVVTDLEGRLLTFGAILRIAPEALKVARAVEGARTLAALAASYHGPVLKVSEDGFLTMFLGGRRRLGDLRRFGCAGGILPRRINLLSTHQHGH